MTVFKCNNDELRGAWEGVRHLGQAIIKNVAATLTPDDPLEGYFHRRSTQWDDFIDSLASRPKTISRHAMKLQSFLSEVSEDCEGAHTEDIYNLTCLMKLLLIQDGLFITT